MFIVLNIEETTWKRKRFKKQKKIVNGEVSIYVLFVVFGQMFFPLLNHDAAFHKNQNVFTFSTSLALQIGSK